MDKKVDWWLLSRAAGDPLKVARERLLIEWRNELNEDAERFLTEILPKLSTWEVLYWLVRRGGTDRRDIEGVASNNDLVRHALATWPPELGFPIEGRSEEVSLGYCAVHAMDSEAWAAIVEERLPTITDPKARHLALCSLRGSPPYERLRASRYSLQGAPPGAYGSAVRDELIERTWEVRRDPRQVVRIVRQLAEERASRGEVGALWWLRELGMLEGVEDPRSVLPARLWFPWIDDEDDFRDPYVRDDQLWAVNLALHWPGDRRVDAHAWLRGQILGALARGAAPRTMQAILFGDRYRLPRASGDGGAPTLTGLLASWLDDPAARHTLQREAFDQGTPLPSVWDILVADLDARRDGAWERAIRWAKERMEDRAVTPMELLQRPWIEDEARSVELIGNVLVRIALEAPLPEGDDAFVEALLDDVTRFCARDGSTRDQDPFDRWGLVVWRRIATLRPTEARRTRLIDVLRARPTFLAEDDVDHVVARIGALAPDELPAFEAIAWTYGPSSDPFAAVPRYLLLGGECAVQRVCEAIAARIEHEHFEHAPLLRLFAHCGDKIPDALRERFVSRCASMHLSWIIAYGVDACAALGRPLDLAAIARERVEVRDERLQELPDTPEFAPLVVARLNWIARQAHEENSYSARWMDEEVLALIKRVSGNDARDVLREVTLARARIGAMENLAVFLSTAGRHGATRRALLAIATDRIVTEPPHALHPNLQRWMNEVMGTRSAWEADGQTFIDLLSARAPEHLATLCLLPRDEPVRDALLMAFARHFATHAQQVAREGDLARAGRFLDAILELDAPSRAFPLLRPLRSFRGQDRVFDDKLEACEQLLRRDAGRAPSPWAIGRALEACGMNPLPASSTAA